MNTTTAPVREGPAPMGDNSMHAHADELAKLETGLDAIKAHGVRSEADASVVRDLGKAAHDHLGALDRDLKERKAPWEAEITKLKAAFNPLSYRAEQVKEGARNLLTAWLQAERVRREREALIEAQRAAEAAAAAEAAREAAKSDTAGPFEAMDAHDADHEAEAAQETAYHAQQVAAARPSVSSASGIAKAASLRVTWGAKVIDGPKAVKHYAKRAEMIELAQKLAAAEMRASKGQAVVPGIEAICTEKAV